MLFDIHLFHQDNIDVNQKHRTRIAVRAVIMHENQITLAYLQKNHEFKFPGGGVEINETLEDALKREVKEEIGARVKSIKCKIGVVAEYDNRNEPDNEYFKMESHYYEVEIEHDLEKQELDKYENDLGFVFKSINIRDALEINRSTMEHGINITKWIKRETLVLEKLVSITNTEIG